MGATTLVKTFLRSVCTTLQDISPQFSRWPEHELVIYANYGQMAIAKYLPQAGSRSDAITSHSTGWVSHPISRKQPPSGTERSGP